MFSQEHPHPAVVSMGGGKWLGDSNEAFNKLGRKLVRQGKQKGCAATARRSPTAGPRCCGFSRDTCRARARAPLSRLSTRLCGRSRAAPRAGLDDGVAARRLVITGVPPMLAEDKMLHRHGRTKPNAHDSEAHEQLMRAGSEEAERRHSHFCSQPRAWQNEYQVWTREQRRAYWVACSLAVYSHGA